MNAPASGQTPDRRELWIGLGCAALILTVWTCFHVLGRLGVKSSFDPADLTAIRIGCGALLMLPFFLRRGMGDLTVFQGISLALTAVIGFTVCAFWGFTWAPVSHSVALMTGAAPLLTALLSVFFLRERFSNMKLLALALIVAGVGVVGLAGLKSGEPDAWIGDILFFMASLSWAIYTILAQRWKVSAVQTTAVVYIFSAIAVMPVYFIFFDSRIPEAPLDELVVQVVMQGIFSSVLSIMAYTRMVQALGSTAGAMLTAAVPVTATFAAIPVIGEYPDLASTIGVAVVTGGLIVTLLTLRRSS
jgi:drug/metabolite transporter (DMT)-like permease